MSGPLNPYASPQAAVPRTQSATEKDQPIARPYKSADGKTKSLLAATGATAIFNVILVILLGNQMAMLSRAREQARVDIIEVANNINSSGVQAISAVATLAYVITFILLLVWVYAVHANLPALNAQRLEFTAPWAVGWFFIPIANLFKPCQVAIEIWRNSDPNPLRATPARGIAIVGWWWGLRVASTVLGRIISFIVGEASTIEDLLMFSGAALAIIMAIDIPMPICQILLIWKVQQMQDERHSLIEKQGQVAALSANPWAAVE
jgi:hypothetical protein